MAEPMFPEITLPAIVVSSPSRVMADPFGRATPPVMSVPRRFPWMIVPFDDSMPMPGALPEIRFLDPGDVPPMVLPFELMRRMPSPREASRVPVASVPM